MSHGGRRPRVLLVQVAREGPDGRIWRPWRLWFHGATLPYLAALFGERCEVGIVDELIEPVPLDPDCDLVGLTFMGASLPRAMRLADAFRARGLRVVAGGTTATAHRDLVLPHVDSLVAGDAEGLVDRLLDDLELGTLKRVYEHDRLPASLDSAPAPRYDLVPRRRVGPYYPVEATRGCSVGCSFCLSSHLHRRVQRRKPVALVDRDLRLLRSRGIRRVLFVDDNVTLDRRYFDELLSALTGMGMRWTANATPDIARDEPLLDRMAASGCESLSIGFETVEQANLLTVGKGRFETATYAGTVDRLRHRGIQTVGLFVLGMDHDHPGTFEAIESFLESNRVEMALFHILTPVAGTPLHERLRSEGRLFDLPVRDRGADRPAFAPAGMSAAELEAGFWALQERFYSVASILRRLLLVRPDRHYLRRLPAVLANLYFRSLARRRQLFI